YASSAPWSLLASTFLAVTRVVGRLPVPPGVTSATQLVALIGAAASHTPSPAARFTPPFALSADVWSASTQLSVANTFGPGMVVELAPPATHPGIDTDLPRLAHFINCHGAQASDEFYGQSGSAYPMAMSSLGAGPHISAQTVATAECCYGAELYDYLAVGTAQPICMAYLDAGATAFLGSTNIAYGPATGNAQADLLTQYFLQHILAGATTGRALLQARQDFIRTQPMADPSNLKTVAQYILLGDPSSQPCVAPSAHGMTAATDFLNADVSAAVMDPGLQRKSRRKALESEGFAIEATASRLGQEIAGSTALLDQLRQLATQRGVAAPTVTVLEVTGGDLFLRAVKDLGGEQRVATVVETSPAAPGWRGPSIKLLVAHIVGERIVSVEHSESR
ncbi:MAG TPA: C25 family cysteine peptidase, partial [Caulobacteraceae bacterium]|nr:C25 family cysteine peptidase [Caulobacteraceae bacterium]